MEQRWQASGMWTGGWRTVAGMTEQTTPRNPENPKSLHCPNCGANVSLDRTQCNYCKAALSLTACPFCFGPVFRGMKYCPNCGTAVDRTSMASDKKLNCPRCGHLLAPARISGVRIDECQVCGGIWLDKAVFQTICDHAEKGETIPIHPDQVEKVELKPVSESERLYIPCPVCGDLMLRKNYAGGSGVIVDWCRLHGTWFDRQELQQIINFIKSGGLQATRKREMDKLHEEQERLRDLQYGKDLEQGYALGHEDYREMTEGTSLLSAVVAILRRIFSDG
jgi:Zn-finger nucleic acid-binding protein